MARRRPLTREQHARRMVNQYGATHTCRDSIRADGRCTVCDRVVLPTRAERLVRILKIAHHGIRPAGLLDEVVVGARRRFFM